MAQVGWEFTVRPVDVSEELKTGIPPSEAVVELALRKAQACPVTEGLVIAADTLVVLDEQVLGKPASVEDAKAMLLALSGREHKVITGVAVLNAAKGEYLLEAEETGVCFRTLAEEEVEAYIRSGEPMDKAGAYGIQGKGALLVDGITGCYFNVVGLPLTRLAKMLQAFGYSKAFNF